MNLLQRINRYLVGCWPQSEAEIDAEIQEELDFHLEMRAQDNILDGMTPEEARGKALQQFGSVNASHQACRRISLGPRLRYARVQSALVVALVCVVTFQALWLLRLQVSSKDTIQRLSQQVSDLEDAQSTSASKSALQQLGTIPYLQFNRAQPVEVGTPTFASDLVAWTPKAVTGRPWSNWDKIEIDEK